MKRMACSRVAGPRNLSGFHQYDGQKPVQQGAQNALVETIEPRPLLRRLQALLLGGRIVVNDIRFDGAVLLEEARQVHDQVADYGKSRAGGATRQAP